MTHKKLSPKQAADAVTPTPPPAPAPTPAAAPAAAKQWAGLRQYLPDIAGWWNKPNYFSPGGAFETAKAQAALTQQNQNALKETEQNKKMLDALILYSLGGLGAGLSGTKLYNMISSRNKIGRAHV